MRDDPERGLNCIDFDKDAEHVIFGDNKDDSFYRLEVILTPCNYLHTDHNYTGDSINPECVPDLDKQTEYIGESNWQIYKNTDQINAYKFGEEAISRYSTI